MKLKHIGIGAVALFCVAALSYVWPVPVGLSEAPNVSFQTLKGEKISLSAWRGNPVLVTFWATSCVRCMQEMPHLISLYKELHKRGLEIVGVAMDYDPPNHVLVTVDRQQVPYTISLDIDGGIARAFDGVRLTPTNFLIDPAGRIVFKKIGAMDIVRLRDDIVEMLNSRAG